jgi:signal transduction histidine kinase
VLTVEDAGPGLTGGHALLRGVSGSGSSGLGLDIVRRAAERTGGTVRFDRADPGGLRVVVDLLGPR